MTWRTRLRPASFRGAPFFVEVGEQAGGRGTVRHAYPKRNVHFTEDMGRRSREFVVTGYTIGDTHDLERAALVAALEADGPGTLTLPLLGSHRVVVDAYTASERREEGGFSVIDMIFAERGVQAFAAPRDDTGAQANAAADNAKIAVEDTWSAKLPDPKPVTSPAGGAMGARS